MKQKPFLLSGMLLLLFILLSGCSGMDTSPVGDGETPSATIPVRTATKVPSVTPSATPTSEPTALPTPTLTPTPLACSIVFDSERDGNLEIYRMDVDGSNPVNLTNDLANDSHPAWSPDGSRIAFVSNRLEGDQKGQYIYIMDAEGNNVQRLTDIEGFKPDWSPDGEKITFHGYSEQGDDIYVIAADGSGIMVNLTNSPENDRYPVWSADGSRIAFLSESGGGWNIFTMKTDGSDLQQVTTDGRVNNVWWTIDGRLLSMGWDSADYGCCNFVMDRDGSNVISAGGKGGIQEFLPIWDIDGNRVECTGIEFEGGNSEIYLIGEFYPDALLNLTNNPAADRNPDWPANCGPVNPGSQSAAETTEENQANESTEAAETNEPGKFMFGYFEGDTSNQQRKDSYKRACNELNLICIYGNIPDLLESGVDAIVINSADINLEELFDPIHLAEENGVPVFLLDAEVPLEGVYSISIDWHVWGKSALGWMFEQMGSEGGLVFFDLDQGYSFAFDLADLLQRYPNIRIVEEFDAGYDLKNLQKDIENILTANPDLKGIWASKNNMELIRAVKDSSLPLEDWPLMLCPASKDGLSSWLDFLKADPNYECLALPNPPSIAFEAVYAAYYLLSGYEINPTALSGGNNRTFLIEPALITNENLSEWWEQVEDRKIDDSTLLDYSLTADEIREKWFIE